MFEISRDDNLLFYRDGKWVSFKLPIAVYIMVERIVDNSTLGLSSERYRSMRESVKKIGLDYVKSVSNLISTVNGRLPTDLIDSSRMPIMKVFLMGHSITQKSFIVISVYFTS